VLWDGGRVPADRDDPPVAADGRDGPVAPDPRTLPPPGSVAREAAAFRWAARGIGAALRSEPHLRFHAVATVAVIVLAVVLPLTATARALLALAVGVVWVAELVNTAVESLVDLVSPGLHPVAGRVKDVAAGAVLVAAVASAVCGVLVLGPPLVAWVGAR
jgi:diacylglycerol kinase (ATP)